MINKRRVQRIKNLIYTVLILLFFLPALLVAVLSVKLIRVADDMAAMLAQQRPAVSRSISEASEPQSAAAGSAAAVRPEADGLQEAKSTVAATASGSEPEASAHPQDTTPSLPNTYTPVQYRELYFETLANLAPPAAKTIYLTFDNTPSHHLDALLAVLERHGVKATFFVWWDPLPAGLAQTDYRKIVSAGHALGIHAGSKWTSYAQLYASKEVFLAEFADVYTKITEAAGIKTRLYRLPGGSISPGNAARQAVLADIKRELDARGFLQFDWNASAQDAVNPPLNEEQIVQNMEPFVRPDGPTVVLLHDGTGSDSTVRALDTLIARYRADGFSFRALDDSTRPISFLENNQGEDVWH